MKNKKLIFSVSILFFLGLVGFQAAEIKLHLFQIPGAVIEDYMEIDYDLGSNYIDSLKPYPQLKKGERSPFWSLQIAGRGLSSFDTLDLLMFWEDWVKFHKKQKPELMKDVKAYLAKRYSFNKNNVIPASNSIMAKDLFKLSHYFENEDFSVTALTMLKNVKPEIQE